MTEIQRGALNGKEMGSPKKRAVTLLQARRGD